MLKGHKVRAYRVAITGDVACKEVGVATVILTIAHLSDYTGGSRDNLR
jgi:hypothetical protein